MKEKTRNPIGHGKEEAKGDLGRVTSNETTIRKWDLGGRLVLEEQKEWAPMLICMFTLCIRVTL